MNKLKPCLRCKELPIVRSYSDSGDVCYWIDHNCHGVTATTERFENKQEVVEVWNWRANEK